MRWSEIGARQIIDIYNGARLGRLDQADMVINPENGSIEELLISQADGPLAGLKRSSSVRVPWKVVRKVGPQIVLVDLQNTGDLPEEM